VVSVTPFSTAQQAEVLDLILGIQRVEFGFDIRAEDQPDLLEALLHSARASRLQEVFLGTTEGFLAAHRFYEKYGFVRVAPDQLPAAFPRMPLDTRFYTLAIASSRTYRE
jgi:hypothetical protein